MVLPRTTDGTKRQNFNYSVTSDKFIYKCKKYQRFMAISSIYKQDGRLPPAYCARPYFCKEGFSEDENVLFSRKIF